MRKPIDHSAMAACGYVKPWGARAGSRVTLHASSSDPEATVGLIRLDHPAAEVPWAVLPGRARVAHRSVTSGSWIEVEGLGQQIGSTLRLEFLVTANVTDRTLVSWGDLALDVAPDRRLAIRVGSERRPSGSALPGSRWLVLTMTLHAHDVTACVHDPSIARDLFRLRCPTSQPGRVSKLRLGSDGSRPAANWRVGRVAFHYPGRKLEWRFPVRGPVGRVASVDGAGPHLEVINDPTFSCASLRWDGSVHDPRLARDHYDAIHLHEDDVGALDWPDSHHVDVPEDAEGGVYAFKVTARAGTEEVPFFVRPSRPRAAVAFLVPTLTYAAYSDEALPQERFPWVCDDRGHRFAQSNGLLSLYDVHADGSGVSLKNIDHPKANLRGDYRYPLSGSPHLLPVDLHLLRFCHSEGIPFDLMTDGDLHAEGVAALRPYVGLFTGSHHEYWTGPMQDGLRQWMREGGSLAHLGGNGLMWVTAHDGTRVEVRRGQSLAARTWDGRPGEINMSLDGQIGGLWRERDRSEFSVVGTGMTMMGFGPARAYDRLAASDDPEWAWIFEGVGEGPIGTTGRVLGGAAGYEVDRGDARLGTPEGTVTLARATGFGPEYEIDGNDYFAGGLDERMAARRADMVVRRHEGGGFVFSVGSVAWCGALPEPGQGNDVGVVTRNVIRRLGIQVDRANWPCPR